MSAARLLAGEVDRWERLKTVRTWAAVIALETGPRAGAVCFLKD